MALISCPECGRQVSDRAVSCPDCGCPISAAPAIAPQKDTEGIEKLFTLARRAREGSDSKNAKKYYDQILDKDPGNWEAIFFSVYYEASECKIMNIASAANSVSNCIYSTFSAIGDLKDEAEQDAALDTVILFAQLIAGMFVSGAVNHYNQFSTTSNAFGECSSRVVAAGDIYSEIADGVKKVFPDKKDRQLQCQKSYLTFLENQKRWYNGGFLSRTRAQIEAEITKNDPVYGKRLELERKISTIDGQLGLVTERKPRTVGGAVFFLVMAAIMYVLGNSLNQYDDAAWPYIVAVAELILGLCLLIPTPSAAVVNANRLRQAQLLEERIALQKELDELGK